jgi:hypothetical protein
MNFCSEDYDAGASTSTLKEEDRIERNTSTNEFMDLIWNTQIRAHLFEIEIL